MGEATPPSAHKQHNKPGATGLKRIWNAAGYSKDGFAAAFRHEAAFRQVLALSAILVVTAFFLPVDKQSRALMVAVALLSPIVELLNTAIEALTDLASPDWQPLAKIAKDTGSAAQTMALLLIALVWAILLF